MRPRALPLLVYLGWAAIPACAPSQGGPDRSAEDAGARGVDADGADGAGGAGGSGGSEDAGRGRADASAAASGDASTTSDAGSIEERGLRIDRSPAEVAAGAQLYVLAEEPIAPLEVWLGDIRLDDSPDFERDDERYGVYRVPATLALGTHTLTLIRPDEPDVRAEVLVTVGAPGMVDIAASSGLSHVHDVTGADAACEEDLTGIASADVDRDGDLDFFVGNYGSGGRFWRGRVDAEDGEIQFEDATAEVGLGGIDRVASVAFVDYDNDGDRDLFVGRRGENRLLQNRLAEEGTLRFEDVTEAAGIGAHAQRTAALAFGDYDGDGDLDFYEGNHTWCWPEEGVDLRASDHFYRNDAGRFVLVDALLDNTLGQRDGLTFVSFFVDVERDGDQDLLVFHDDVHIFSEKSVAWRNDGPGPTGQRFVDVSESARFDYTERANVMGGAIADLNDDRLPDVALSSIRQNLILESTAEPFVFDETARVRQAQRRATPWRLASITWGTHFLDWDNDQRLDLAFIGGPIVEHQPPVPHALLRGGEDGRFEDITWAAGFSDVGHGKASALVDIDRDGLLDLVVAHWGRPLRVFRNEGIDGAAARHWLAIELEGTRSNRDAIGAIVEVDTSLPQARTQTCFLTSRPSLGAGGELLCHFGLGENASVDALRVYWPSGTVQTVEEPPVDQRIRIVEPGLDSGLGELE